MSSADTTNPTESSGTIVVRDDNVNFGSPFGNGNDTASPSTEQTIFSREGEEQALESHEVIELQAFSERKNWIEEKVKFLENMPPIEVFVGLDAIRSSTESVPGLPTRAELQQWLTEHDTIEKETEIFDSGELKKLKKFTKAATQRNLSPQDTDLIELTLTTIYELDKLLHLLRDRSENLDLLGVRLTWEEHRVAAWVDRRSILQDLQTFLATRARWSPSVYDPSNKSEEPSNRPGSVASMASESSVSSSPGFSRSARFKLAELLSRDAAQFVGRVTSLRHGKISAAGKALDKLIENSRKPVPEEFLDEQDKIEEKGIKEMENINKFVMNVVMQWRKADELYVETIKDQFAARNLLEEVETAKLYSPSARQSTSFVTRADALVKRLSLRRSVASSSSTFPRPVHPLFPDQPASNIGLAQTLSSEITIATDLARKVDAVAKEYRSMYEAVRDVETLTQAASDLSVTFTTIIDHLDVGVPTDDGDGTSPDLTSEVCLEPTQHSVFLALLPSVLEDSDKATEEAGRILRSSHGALLRLDVPGIDSSFKSNAASEIQKLIEMRDRTETVRNGAIARVNRLRAARRIWAVMGEGLKSLQDIRRLVGGAMEMQRWKPQTVSGGAPLTPESPSAVLPPDDVVPASVMTRLDDMLAKFTQDIEEPLMSMSPSLEAPLNHWLTHSYKGLIELLESVRQMTHLLESIRKQAEIMGIVQNEFNDFQLRIEDLKISFDSSMEQVLTAKVVDKELDCDLKAKTAVLRDVVQAFIDGLTRRIRFVDHRREPSGLSPTFVKRRFSSVDLKLGGFQQQPVIELPFDLSCLDDAVRADCNSFTIRLSGNMQAVMQKENYFQLARMAKEVDSILSSIVDSINFVTHELGSFKHSFSLIMDHGSVMDPLQSLCKDVEDFLQTHRATIARSFSPIRDLLRRMDSAPGAHDPAVYEVVYLARNRNVDDAELKFNSWNEDMASFRTRIMEAQRMEQEHMDEQRRLQAEKEHAAAEEAERAKVEQERLVAEEKSRSERMEEERRIQAEREREGKEEAERLRMERERLEAERLGMEEARLAQEQVERERAARAEAERLRVEQERLVAEEVRKREELRLQVDKERKEAEEAEKLKVERQKLEEERLRVDAAARQLRAEKERMAAEETERLRVEHERLEAMENLRVEQERRAEELRVQAEMDHAKNESERLEVERLRQETKGKLRIDEARMASERRLEGESLIAEEAPKAEKISRATKKMNDVVPRKKIDLKANNGRVKQANEDVFGLCVAPSLNHVRTEEMRDLQARILTLRKQLRSINLEEVSRPSSSSSSSTHLPTQDQAKKMDGQLSLISKEVAQLPSTVDDVLVDVELKSLRTEVEASLCVMQRVFQLASMSDAVYLCDTALSDLLEHIDSYPAIPLGSLLSSHNTQLNLPPEEQLSARLSFTHSAIDEMASQFSPVADDNRAIVERKRILQTWSELEDMGKDRVAGAKSRSTSADRNSSGRNSRTSGIGSLPPVPRTRKLNDYSNLSVGSRRGRGRFLTPSHPVSKRVVSDSAESSGRPSSQMSSLSNRSVSGPFSSSLFSSTYASRQRTTSLSSSTSISTPIQPPLLVRAQTGQKKRPGSPTGSEASYSRSVTGSLRSSSTWARAPRQSFSTLPKASPPRKRTPFMPKTTYVANPRNKLDIAVGDVVNKLPVNINIEVVAETWKDQSGKYWIGDQDPKLCFCRILRSQTVMVRVGGGWSELSKFIKDHFADLFRIAPESPLRPGTQEEKWISSATLLEAPESPERTETPLPPRTPEPTGPFVPSFSLLTPSGLSPRSLKSNSSPGSPLTPLQFMRRADGDSPGLRPVTPSKAPTLRSRTSTPHTPARISVWRP